MYAGELNAHFFQQEILILCIKTIENKHVVLFLIQQPIYFFNRKSFKQFDIKP